MYEIIVTHPNGKTETTSYSTLANAEAYIKFLQNYPQISFEKNF